MAFIQTGEYMKLLNLWPQEQEVVQPQKRLLLEMLLALLLVIVVLLSVGLWFDWRSRNLNLANQQLKTESAKLQQSRTVEIASNVDMLRVMRQLLAGQLDWMGELPQWLVDQRVHWVSTQFDDGGLHLVGVAVDSDAINAMLQAVAARYTQPPVQVSEIANVNMAGQNVWRFEMHIDSHALRNKVQPALNQTPLVAPNPAAQENDDSTTTKSSNMGGGHER